MLNWSVWNRTVYMYKYVFVINNLQWSLCHKSKPSETKGEKSSHVTKKKKKTG